MAGGKETPRQKLIGIMYLILLALLALQVSSAIMEKFKFLDDSLQFANESSKKNATGTIKGIEKKVGESGNKPADVAVLNKANEVHTATMKIVDFITKLREEMVNGTDGYEVPGDKTSMFKGAKEETKIEVMMVGSSKNGKAYELQKEVNGYCAELTKITGEDKFTPLALDGKDDKRITEKQQKSKDFAELNFAQTPMVASMAVLSNLQAEILKYDNEALADLGGDIGQFEIKFDKIVANYSAESKVVAAGTKYTCYLYLTASSSAIKPRISVGGANVPVDADGRGKYEITARPGNYDKDGNAKNGFNFNITISNKGKDTSFQGKVEYIVAKPVIQVQAAAVSALYRNCGNEINVQVPALGSVYQPSFSGSSGGDFIPGGSKGAVTIVPNGNSVTLKVSSGGNYIGDQVFKVKGIPLPQILCFAGSAPVNEKQGMPSPGPRSLILNAKPDEAFGTFLPKDAKYDVKQYEILLVRGKRPVQTKMGSGKVCDLSSFAAVANPGDRIVIDVKKVSRTNFRGVQEDVPGISKIINIPLN